MGSGGGRAYSLCAARPAPLTSPSKTRAVTLEAQIKQDAGSRRQNRLHEVRAVRSWPWNRDVAYDKTAIRTIGRGNGGQLW
jgi:hypothetical protein